MDSILALPRFYRFYDTADSGTGGGSADSAGTPPANADIGGLGEVNEGAEDSSSPEEGSGSESPTETNQNIKQLRQAYDELKGKYEPFKDMDPQSVQKHRNMVNAQTESAINLGLELGYTEDEIRKSLDDNFDETIKFILRQQMKAEKEGKQSSPELKDLTKKISDLEKQVKGFDASRKQEQEKAATRLFDETFAANVKELFKGQNLSEDEYGPLRSEAIVLMYQDEAAMKRLLEEGKTSDIAKYAKKAVEMYDKRYLARRAREEKRGPTLRETESASDSGEGAPKGKIKHDKKYKTSLEAFAAGDPEAMKSFDAKE
jgi:hypothetical protein